MINGSRILCKVNSLVLSVSIDNVFCNFLSFLK